MDALINNTAFVSIADFKKPAMEIESLLQTADFFGVKIQWASYGNEWGGFLTKCSKIIELLERIKSHTNFVFYIDSKDVVFTDSIHTILKKFNQIYSGGVIFNSSKLDHLHPYRGESLKLSILKNYPKTDFINAGVYCGEINYVLDMLRACMDLNRRLKAGDDLPSTIKNIITSQEYVDLSKYYSISFIDDDQFLIHLLQTIGSDLIVADRSSYLLSTCRKEFPDEFNKAKYSIYDVRYVGDASIIHFPGINGPYSANITTMNMKSWVNNFVLRKKYASQ